MTSFAKFCYDRRHTDRQSIMHAYYETTLKLDGAEHRIDQLVQAALDDEDQLHEAKARAFDAETRLHTVEAALTKIANGTGPRATLGGFTGEYCGEVARAALAASGVERRGPDTIQSRYEEYAADCLACVPYLKEGEKPADCIARNRADASTALGLHAKSLQRAEHLEARIRSAIRCLDGFVEDLKLEIEFPSGSSIWDVRQELAGAFEDEESAEEGLGPAAAGVATRDTEKPGSGNDYTGKPRSCCGSDHRGREHGPQCALPDGYPECEHSILYTLDFANQPQRLDRCLFCELGEARRLLDEDLALYGKGTPQPMDVLKAAHDRIVGTDSEENGR